MERLRKQMQFIMEIDKLKNIYRQSYISDGTRHENDSEHSWSLAMMCILFSEYAPAPVDVLKATKMVLIHDIVEIDAGDTYAYDTAGNATKRAREEKAADRIFNILPVDQAKEMRQLWEEFEEGETMEAKYAITMDKVQPILLNDITGGKAWREHEVTLDKIMNRNKNTGDGANALWEYARELIMENVSKGNIIES